MALGKRLQRSEPRDRHSPRRPPAPRHRASLPPRVGNGARVRPPLRYSGRGEAADRPAAPSPCPSFRAAPGGEGAGRGGSRRGAAAAAGEGGRGDAEGRRPARFGGAGAAGCGCGAARGPSAGPRGVQLAPPPPPPASLPVAAPEPGPRFAPRSGREGGILLPLLRRPRRWAEVSGIKAHGGGQGCGARPP